MPASQSTSKDNQSKEIVFAQIGSLLSTQTRQSFWKWNASYEEELQRPIERDSEAIWGTLLHLVIALAMAQTSWNFMTPLAAMISVSRLPPSTSCDPQVWVVLVEMICEVVSRRVNIPMTTAFNFVNFQDIHIDDNC